MIGFCFIMLSAPQIDYDIQSKIGVYTLYFDNTAPFIKWFECTCERNKK